MRCRNQFLRILTGTAVALLFICALCVPVVAASDDDEITFELPLTDGSVDLAALLCEGLRSAGITPTQQLRSQSWPVDVTSALGRLQLRAIDKLTDSIITVNATSDTARVTIDKTKLRRSADASRGWLNDLLESGAPPTKPFGMFVINEDDTITSWKNADFESAPQRAIILVHGLDDPGWMWDDMIDALQGEKYETIVRFEYPNDGPISEAADLLAMELRAMRAAGVERVDLVAHSMGGLVCRDVLTRPAYYNGDGAGHSRGQAGVQSGGQSGGDQKFPAVDHLIMLGTPNHGSHLARMRAVTEWQEQITRASSGTGHLLGSLRDGDGEAAIDLAPGSQFLRRLNDRPLPAHTKITSVAGRMSPISEDDAQELVDRLEKIAASDLAPSWLREWLDDAQALPVRLMVGGMIDGVGDGAVTLESTRLDGVEDYVVVDANHISMIVNTGDTIAPGIAIVLTRLGEE